jgi:acyl-CoA thioesterase FadM
MGESAALHAAELGMSIETLKQEGLGWMLRWAKLSFDRQLPLGGDNITVETWPSAMRRIYADRDFVLWDATVGAQIGAARYTWMAVDLEARKPVRLPAATREVTLPVWPRAPVDPTEETASTVALESGVNLRFQVREADLDQNAHLSHIRYVEWALEAMPSPWEPLRLVSLEVLFRAEARLEERLLGTAAPIAARTGGREAPAWQHVLRREADGLELARLVTRWVPAVLSR